MPGFRGIGESAERAAIEFLLSAGFAIVTRNYKRGSSEIDIIAMDGDELVFVEVRSRRRGAWESAEESVTPKKQARLWKTAEQYLADIDRSDHPCRFDVVAINAGTISHYKDAFRPTP